MKNFLLILILLLALFLRLFNLPNIPPSPSMDESSIGYNAYSVLKTGADEFGEFPLISQRGYDDWRRSTYLFLTIPFIKFLGLNVLAVRLSAAILSVLTVLSSYFLVRQLFISRGTKQNPSTGSMRSLQASSGQTQNYAESIALLASFLLAISPWHIYISRLGHESNANLSFLIFGILFFLKSNSEKKWIFLLISGIFFTLSMISYYSGQALVPLFVLGLFIIYRKSLLSIITSNKKILALFFIFLILLIPVFLNIFSQKALIRFQGTSTFTKEAHQELFAKRVSLFNESVKNNNIIGMIIYNRRFFPVQVFAEGYLSHFNPKWLFSNSSSEPFKIPGFGLLYIWEAPLLTIGIIFLLFSRIFERKTKGTIFLWLALAAVPAAIATQTPHAMRSYNLVLVLQILSALGLFYFFYNLKKFTIPIFLGFVVIVLVSLLNLYQNYFYVFPKEQSSSFQYALSKTVPFVLENEKYYEKIVFSNKDNLYQSYMIFLFQTKYDPFLYKKQGGTKSGGFAETHQFGKFEFRPIDWLREEKNGKILYIGNSSDFPKHTDSLVVFLNLDGKEAIKAVR